jgi:SAM-dependent methyltransferase
VLIVPEKFNRNSPNVTAVMPPEESGLWLLERMRQRLGFASYADKKVLDFGCGVRFTQAILHADLPFGRYVGVDNYEEMIEFLRTNVRDRRFAFHFLDAQHPLFNKHGKWLAADMELPLRERDFDVISMFSVITHQNPADSRAIFTMLRRYVKADGHLFFTCFIDDAIGTFEDRSPQRNGGSCFYNAAFLAKLVESCGWRTVDFAPREAPLIGESYVCRPRSV